MSHTTNKGSYRATYTLPTRTFRNIGYVAERLAISQSAALSLLVGDMAEDVARVLQTIPCDGKPLPIKRLRGESEKIIKERYAEALGLLAEME